MRTATSLNRGIDGLQEIKAALLASGLPDPDREFNLTWHDWLNLRSLMEISEVIAGAALWRENSRGAHFREDFPQSGAMEDSYFTVATQADNGTLEITRRPVNFSIVQPGETLLTEATETLAAAE